MAALVLVLLLVFVIQNSQHVSASFLGAHGQLPLGVALFLSAASGIILVAIRNRRVRGFPEVESADGPYAARRVDDAELACFNVMVNTLRTDPEMAGRPLDAICARQLTIDIRTATREQS